MIMAAVVSPMPPMLVTVLPLLSGFTGTMPSGHIRLSAISARGSSALQPKLVA